MPFFKILFTGGLKVISFAFHEVYNLLRLISLNPRYALLIAENLDIFLEILIRSRYIEGPIATFVNKLELVAIETRLVQYTPSIENAYLTVSQNNLVVRIEQAISGLPKGTEVVLAKCGFTAEGLLYLDNPVIFEGSGEVILQIKNVKLLKNGSFSTASYNVVKTASNQVYLVVEEAGGAMFSKNAISKINGFSDNVLILANNEGLSIRSFKDLQIKSASDLAISDPEGLAKIISMRNSIPNPNSNTIIQKVIPLDKIDDFIIKGYKPRGFVTTAADSKHLNTYKEIYDGMRLDYKIDQIGTQAFNTTDNGCYVIRFKATNANQAIPAVDIPNPDPFPYTNHGFTSGMNNKLGVPEWKMPDAEITEGIIYRKNIDGSEIEYAVWDATLNKFILK
jgi:hypothetical protein